MTKVNFDILNTSGDASRANENELKRISRSGYNTRSVTDDNPEKPKALYARDKQISIKGPAHVIENFQAICTKDRWAYWQMLEMMTNKWISETENTQP